MNELETKLAELRTLVDQTKEQAMTKAQNKLAMLLKIVMTIDGMIEDSDGKTTITALESMAKRLTELASEAAEEVYRISERYGD
jgi:hypothetical protein